MNTKSNSIKMVCAVVLLGTLAFIGQAQNVTKDPATTGQPGDAAARLEAELKAAKAELLAAQAQAAEQNRRIAQLESQLKGANIAPTAATNTPSVDVAQLQQELKTSKAKISQLEEDLFVATDGKGTKGKEVAEVVPEGTYAWTENMRRSPVGALFPKTATIPQGDFYARFSHTAQNPTFRSTEKGNAFNDLLGLESQVKVGILFGYGIMDNWDVMVQRFNGRTYTRDTGEQGSYDLWDVMTKYKFLDENKYWIDASVSLGGTYFWQNEDVGRLAGNFALMAEKSIWRFRLGSGLLYTSLSTYEKTAVYQSGSEPSKNYPNEIGGMGDPNDPDYTAAVPLSLSFALTKNHQLFTEAAFPFAGYHTDGGPSLTSGWSYNTPTHAYRVYLSNTPNGSFNSSFTGGYKDERLDLFGFDISIFF
jgi:outer membrane murein-binding lipoprotein Lpp